MVVLSVVLNFVQVFRSEQAAHQLQRLVAPTARVWRDGRLVEISVRSIVPGDLLELRAGDLLPADAELRTSTTLSLDEAALTGESLPVEKSGGDGAAARLFAGTSVVSGVGQAVVTTTGSRTQFGTIARALVEKAPPTEYERGARGFGFVIMRTVLGLVLLVLVLSPSTAATLIYNTASRLRREQGRVRRGQVTSRPHAEEGRPEPLVVPPSSCGPA